MTRLISVTRGRGGGGFNEGCQEAKGEMIVEEVRGQIALQQCDTGSHHMWKRQELMEVSALETPTSIYISCKV